MNIWAKVALVVATIIIQGAITRHLMDTISGLRVELEQEKQLVEVWQKKADAASAAQIAIGEQAQSCLEREIKGMADAQIWYDIIETSQIRDLEDEEKKGVPDDKTRRNLLDSLDEPL